MHRLNGFIVCDDDKWLYDWFGIETTCPADIEKWLAEEDDDRTLYINSYGGDTMAASQIYTSLKRHGGVTAVIDGYACSAASYAPLGCKTVKISPTGQIMIHNTLTRCTGDYRDMDNASEMLKSTNTSIINAYKLKTGLSDDVLQAYMDRDKWFNAYEAKELGFVDEILFDESGNDLPKAIINAINLQSRAVFAAINMPDVEEMRESWARRNREKNRPQEESKSQDANKKTQTGIPAESLHKRLNLISH